MKSDSMSYEVLDLACRINRDTDAGNVCVMAYEDECESDSIPPGSSNPLSSQLLSSNLDYTVMAYEL